MASTTQEQSQQEQEHEEREQQEQRPSLNMLNWLNLIFYIINFVFTYGIGTGGWLGNGNNSELSEKYQTLITPSSSAFIIWAVIFIFQGIFVIVQLLPRFRSLPMIQDGVSYYWIITCITQVGWTFAFAYEIIWLSLIFMIAIWLSLMTLLYSQYYTKSDQTLLEFWLLRFPFAIHAGWITAASALNVNVVVVWQMASAPIQLGVGIVSLAVLHAISVWVLFAISNANYTIAGVLCWANGWIYSELQSPKTKITNTFDEDIITGVSYAAIAVSFIILAQIVVRVSYDLFLKKYINFNKNNETAALLMSNNNNHDNNSNTDEESGVVGHHHDEKQQPMSQNKTEEEDNMIAVDLHSDVDEA